MMRHVSCTGKKFRRRVKNPRRDKNARPDFQARAYYLEAWTWELLGDDEKKFQALEKILPLLNFSAPEEKKFAADVLSLMGYACELLGLLNESKEFHTLAVKFLPPSERWKEFGGLIACENFRENLSADYFRALCAEYQKFFADIKPYPRKFYNHKKIRVGFLSGNFYSHVVVQWSRSLLTKLDKNFFETYFYSSRKKKDFVTKQLRATADSWRDIFDLRTRQRRS